eukprot:1710511-Pyramimonas_sp.AAC.1
MKAERRRGKLWAPKGKSLPLQALEDPSTGSLLTSPSDMRQALKAQWAPGFAFKTAPPEKLKKYLSLNVKPFDWST